MKIKTLKELSNYYSKQGKLNLFLTAVQQYENEQQAIADDNNLSLHEVSYIDDLIEELS